jgi:hypothetical protein
MPELGPSQKNSIETHFDIPLIAAMALKEKQIQQNYRPIIAVHKWFARRPGTLFRGLVLAEFGTRPLGNHRADRHHATSFRAIASRWESS